MVKRFSCKKISIIKDARCYYCKKLTDYVLFDKREGSEVWCCVNCLWNVGKIRKFNPTRLKKRSVKIEPVIRVKKIEDGYYSGRGLKNGD